MAVFIARQIPRRNELAEKPLPHRHGGFLADAEHRQLVVAVAYDPLVRFARQDVGDIRHPEPLARSIGRRQCLLCEYSAVLGLGRIEAVVAVAARLAEPFAKVSQQRLPPAAWHLGKADQRVELLPLHLFERVSALRLRDPLAQLHDVLKAIGHPRVGRFPVAPRAARFLIIGLNCFRQIEVGDKAHVGLVDAHAERHCRDNDDAVLVQELCLHAGADVRFKPGMIGQRQPPLGVEPRRRLFDRLARQAVDDTGIARVLGLKKLPELFPCAGGPHLGDRVADVGAIETRDETGRIFERQFGHDLLAGTLVCRCRQRDAWYAREAFGQDLELAILGPEVVPPLRHAVRFVDGEQRHLVLRQHVERAFLHEAFRCDVQKIEGAGCELAFDFVLRLPVQRRVEKRGPDADVEQSVDLVLHQSDQR